MYRLLLALTMLAGCKSTDQYQLDLQEMTDAQYPDNPHIGYRSSNYQADLFTGGLLTEVGDMVIDFDFGLDGGNHVSLSGIHLENWIPTAPAYTDGNAYLQELAVINQEWNRNQVAFRGEQFSSDRKEIARVDIARNCLNAYLWEVILYVEEGGKELPYAHAWFDFPHDLYAEQFSQCNALSYDNYRSSLEYWQDPQHKHIDVTDIRQHVESIPVTSQDLSDSMYPIAGERAKKRKEVVYPVTFTTMRDLQSDSTTFATFTTPGYYNREDPRKTELARFRTLDTTMLSEVIVNGGTDTLHEIVLHFSNGDRRTRLYIGGIDLASMPVLPVSEANSAWKNSMGFGNHTFYESYDAHRKQSLRGSPYYAYLTDGQQHWLDSHHVGIDGPLIHIDPIDGSIHLWLLSFERHALIGHYRFTIDE